MIARFKVRKEIKSLTGAMERGQHRGSDDLRIFWAVKSACSFIGVLLRANFFFFFASHREITRHRDGVKRLEMLIHIRKDR